MAVGRVPVESSSLDREEMYLVCLLLRLLCADAVAPLSPMRVEREEKGMR